MKSSGPYGDPGSSLPRYSGQHGPNVPTTGLVSHPAYLPQHQSIPTLHSSFSSLGSRNAGSSPHGPRDYHSHHHVQGELSSGMQHRGHMSGQQGIGVVPGHLPQRRRTSGHRLSLLRDIGVAGERERDRTESSVGSLLPHSYSGSGSASSHAMSAPGLYGGRPNMSMLSSMGGLHSSQKPLISGSAPSQSSSATPPRHNIAGSGQSSRSSSSIHQQQHPGGSSYLVSGNSSVKVEPALASYIKEESNLSKSPIHSIQAHNYPPQLIHSQTHPAHQSQHAGSLKTEPHNEEVENMPSKDTLLASMEKVDKEINKVSIEIKGLERKKQQLETVAKKPPITEKSASPKKVEPKHRDLWQVIYAENRKKAEAARGMLDHLCKHYEMPLYNQPCDTKVYQDNLKKNEEMRPKLLAYFQRRSQLSNIRERYLCARYDQLMSEWQKKVEKIENNPKRKVKDVKVREFFEKQFPEIRKQREQQERFSRTGTRGDTCRSEADFNEIVDTLSEQEHQEQHMRQLAVVPPMLLDRDERRLKFINNNGLVTDPLEDYKKRQELDHWSAQEKQIFKEKYVQHPKNFHMISSFLEKKTVANCVLFYYLTKKSVGYKQLVRKNNLKPRKVKNVRGQTQQASSTSQDIKGNSQPGDKGDKDGEQKRESPEIVVKSEEIERIDRPPSPRMTRSRNKMNWTDDDISTAKEGFLKHGKDFAAISRLFPNKSEHQIKNFYHNYKKKHNLDQLILEGKRKKNSQLNEGSRRTRTQHQPSTSSDSKSPVVDDEMTALDDSRPPSADLQVSATESESSKKRKKDDDKGEKKEKGETKVQPEKSSESIVSTTTATTTTETEPSTSSAPVFRVTTPVLGSSQIRTRRSAAGTTTSASTEVTRTEATKRSPESSTADEPAEKKAKKSKSAKEAKTEVKDVEKPEQSIKNESTNLATKEMDIDEKNGAVDSKAEKATEEADIPEKETTVETESESKVLAPSSSTTTTSTPVSAITTIVTETKTPVSKRTEVKSEPMPAPAIDTKSATGAMHTTPKTQLPPLHTLPSRLLSGRENDGGDSSATCSADEEPNMQDVESSKAGVRKHADSPYAFEDDSSASIKLESSRVSMAPRSTPNPTVAPTTTATQPPVFAAPPINVGRPSSTHPPPQMTLVPQDEKRPQSLPPPPGALGITSVPISALSFQPAPVVKQQQQTVQQQQKSGNSQPNSTPSIVPPSLSSVLTPKSLSTTAWHLPNQGSYSGHIVGKVPEPSEFRSALRTVNVSQNKPVIPSSINQPVIVTQSKPIKQDVSQTIDLTVPATRGLPTSEDPNKRLMMGKDPIQRPQHYHPVPQEATSLQKDFLGQKMEVKDDPAAVSRPHKYTPSDVAMMRDRAAPIPAIPVMSLRAPMPSTSQSRDVRLSEPVIKIKREAIPSVIESSDKAMHGLNYPRIDPGKPLSVPTSLLHQVPISLTRSSLTTSSIPTKYVSGTMTSGAPVLQKQPLKQPILTPPTIESRKLEGLIPGQLPRPGDAHLYPRRPPEHGHSLESRSHPPELIRKSIQESRPSIVKNVPEYSRGVIEQSHSDPNRGIVKKEVHTGKAPGSIMTGLPVNRPQDARAEPRAELRKDIIAGRDILVQPAAYPRATIPDSARSSEASARQEMAARSQLYPGMRFSLSAMHPALIQGHPTKSISGQGSILDGTPVKRKPSDESTSSLSPSANPAAYHGVVVSRPSPTLVPPSLKQSERSASNSSRPGSETRAPHQAYLPMKEDPYHRRTPDKLTRDPTPGARVASPSHRHTPTSLLAQHPLVKQEMGGSPMSVEEMIRRNPLATGLIDHQIAVAAAAANQELLRMPGLHQLPLGLANPELQSIMQQYQAARLPGGVVPAAMHPALFLPPHWPALFPTATAAGAGSPLAPRSPQSDDSRETTAKLLNNDFLTAQVMQSRKPPPALVTAGSLFPPSAAISTPGLQGVPPLVVSGASAYHPLAAPYAGIHQAALPSVDRLHFIQGHPALTRSPFPSQFQPQTGRSSTESSLSPSQRPTKPASPEIRQRHRSGEPPREFTNHPAIKERNSPVSPLGYPSPRGNVSPRDRYTPQGSSYQQQSPSHSQRSSSSHYPHYPHSSTPSSQPTYHHPSKSPHMVPQHYLGAEMLNKFAEAGAVVTRSSPYLTKHSRSGSFDGSIHNRIDRPRPDSAGPHPRSLPQSPNLPDSIKPTHEYSIHGGRDSQSPKYRIDPKQPTQPSSMASHGSIKVQQKKDERSMHRSSPRPSQKPPSDRIDVRQQQPAALVPSAYHGETSSTPQKQRTRSPYPIQQPPQHVQQGKEVLGRPQQERPVDRGLEGAENYQRNASKNPGEDLKRSGRTKMRAATFIDQIIHKEFLEDGKLSPGEPHKQQQNIISGKHQQSEQASGSRPPEKNQAVSAPDPQIPSQRISEVESKQTPAPMSYGVHPFAFAQYAAAQAVATRSASPSQLDKTKATLPSSLPPSRGLTFAEHSADVINECYRVATERNASPAPTAGGSPRTSRPSSATTGSVTPPERRSAIAAPKPELKTAPPLTTYQPSQQFHQRLPAPTTVSMHPAVEHSLLGDARPPMPLPRMPTTSHITPQPAIPSTSVIQQQPTPSSSSLEDIIRKALLNNDGSPTTASDLQSSQDKVMSMSAFSPDMMVQHAMISSARGPPSSNLQSTQPQLSSPAAPAQSESRREASSQPQSGSEKYMSALMFRQIPGGSQPQNAPPAAAQASERQQQFYQGGRPGQPTASQSPAPAQDPPPSQQQRHQAPAIQYEALSD